MRELRNDVQAENSIPPAGGIPKTSFCGGDNYFFTNKFLYAHLQYVCNMSAKY